MSGREVTLPISICVCTRNRPTELARALRSLEHSTRAIVETIVSDDSTDSDSYILCRDSFPDVRYVVGPRRGIGPNRNNAIRLVRTEYVLFLDDDDQLPGHFLEAVASFIDGFPVAERARLIVTGTEMTNGKLVLPQDTSFLGFQKRPYRSDRGLRTIVNTSTVFPTSVFAVVGFDENVVYGYEDTDVGIRAAAANYEIALCRDAQNVHEPSTISRDYYRPYTDASRLYLTLKQYIFVQKRPFRAFAFALIAPIHLIAHRTKAAGPKGALEAVRIIGRAAFFMMRRIFDARSPDGPAFPPPYER